MERERFGKYNLNDLDPIELFHLIRRGDQQAMFFVARKIGFAAGSGVVRAGFGLQEKVAESVRS